MSPELLRCHRVLSCPACCPALHGLSPLETHLRLAAWLTGALGVAAVLDLGTARDLVLLETAAEFVQRWVRG